MLQDENICEEVFANTFENLDKWKYSLKNTTLKWTPQEIESPIFIKEPMFVFKDSSIKRSLDSWLSQ